VRIAPVMIFFAARVCRGVGCRMIGTCGNGRCGSRRCAARVLRCARTTWRWIGSRRGTGGRANTPTGRRRGVGGPEIRRRGGP
jgi:hypothetical protein